MRTPFFALNHFIKKNSFIVKEDTSPNIDFMIIDITALHLRETFFQIDFFSFELFRIPRTSL